MSTADVTGGLDSEERAYPVRVVAPPTAALQVVTSMFGTLVEILGTAGIVIIFVIFFLLRREDLRDRFIRLVGHAQVTVTTQALDDAAERVSKYLAMQLLINALFGFAVAVGLFVIGIPNAILWGLLGTALRFIPYIGPWIAALIPILLSLAISTGWTKPIATVGMFITLELIVNNVLEPLFYGSRTGVSPVAVLAAAVFWTWLWGGAGLLLATPLTVCLVVLGKYVPQLVFLDIVLGDQPVFDEKTRVYQRLLAGDAEEATELVADRFQTSSLVDVYDSLLLPALAIAEKERHRGELDEYGHRFVYQSLRALTDELAVWEQQRINQLSEKADAGAGVQSERIVPKGAKLCVLCLPARDEADEIAGIMLARLLEFSGICADTASVTSLASEMIEGVAERNSDLVCVSAMPPAAVTHARYLCKRLNARYPEVPLVVGLWNARGDMIKARERIGCGSTVRIATSLSGALEEIRALAQPLLVSLSSPGQKNAPESLAATRSP
jgi:methylmalonyl-CoA mutase cobalamin-binding subunit